MDQERTTAPEHRTKPGREGEGTGLTLDVRNLGGRVSFPQYKKDKHSVLS